MTATEKAKNIAKNTQKTLLIIAPLYVVIITNKRTHKKIEFNCVSTTKKHITFKKVVCLM